MKVFWKFKQNTSLANHSQFCFLSLEGRLDSRYQHAIADRLQLIKPSQPDAQTSCERDVQWHGQKQKYESGRVKVGPRLAMGRRERNTKICIELSANMASTWRQR